MHDGRALVDHAAAVLRPFADCVVNVGGAGARVPDLPKAGLGPLGGIAGALHHAAARGFDSVITIGCDMPRVPTALLTQIAAHAPGFCSDAPVLGHWPAGLSAHLLAYLDTEENRSVRRWAAAVGAAPFASPVPIINVNTPADLDAL